MATTITLDSLNKDTELKNAPSYEDSILTNGNAIISNSLNSVLSDQKIVDDSIKSNQSVLDTIAKNNEALKGKTAYKTSQYDTMGVNTEKANLDKYSQELNSISANLSGLNRESQAIPLQIQEQFKNTGATDTGVAPIQTGKLRENAIKALTQASLADIAIANIKNSEIRYNTAKEKADQAVDLKFEPIENEIKALKEQLELNKAYITDPAEKRLVASQEKILGERTRLLEKKKQEEKDMNDLRIEIAKNGGNPNVINKATNFAEAINLSVNALRTPNNEIVKMGDNLAYVVDKNTGKIINTLGGSGIETGGNTPSSYLANLNSRTLQSIDELLPQVSYKTVGAGSLLSNLPNTPARNFEAQVKTLKASIAFGELQAMRQASKTGGALGNVALGELELLENSLGALDTMQSPENFKAQLNKIKTSLNKWNQAVAKENKTSVKSGGSPITGMSDRQAVEFALKSAGKDYASYVNQAPKNQIPVIEKSTGKAGYMPYAEFNPSLYIKA